MHPTLHCMFVASFFILSHVVISESGEMENSSGTRWFFEITDSFITNVEFRGEKRNFRSVAVILRSKR